MIAFVKVLIGSLARLLRSAAEFLGRWATAAPEVPFLPAAGGGILSAPEDWIRRAVPPPPAHWLAVVRARAPNFQPADPRVRSERREPPALSRVLRSVSPATAPVSKHPATSPTAADPRQPVRRPLHRAGLSPAAFPRRVVTVVEEQPPRVKRESDARGGAFEPTPGRPGREGGEVAALRPSKNRIEDTPVVPELPISTIPLDAVMERRTPEAASASVARRSATPPTPRIDSPLWFPVSEAPEGDRRETPSRWNDVPLPTFPTCRPEATAPLRDEGRPGWPALPEVPADGPRDLWRQIHREAQLLAELEREQRGLPWSA